MLTTAAGHLRNPERFTYLPKEAYTFTAADKTNISLPVLQNNLAKWGSQVTQLLKFNKGAHKILDGTELKPLVHEFIEDSALKETDTAFEKREAAWNNRNETIAYAIVKCVQEFEKSNAVKGYQLLESIKDCNPYDAKEHFDKILQEINNENASTKFVALTSLLTLSPKDLDPSEYGLKLLEQYHRTQQLKIDIQDVVVTQFLINLDQVKYANSISTLSKKSSLTLKECIDEVSQAKDFSLAVMSTEQGLKAARQAKSQGEDKQHTANYTY